MLRKGLFTIICLSAMSTIAIAAEDPVFSGPQAGEPLPALTLQGVVGELDGKTWDPVADADGKPILLVFFHELTRPAFGMSRVVTQFAAERSDPGMETSVVFLTDDPTATTKWAKNVSKYFSDGVNYGVSPDGKEGPGSYGLNRNVTLTILVAHDGKVTKNFALVQPQLQADGPGVLQAIADVTGGGEVPSISKLMAERGMSRQMNRERGAKQRPASDPSQSTE